MSDYTKEELQDMLNQKEVEEHEAQQLAYESSSLYLFEQQMMMTIKSIDYYHSNVIARASKVMNECKQISKKFLFTGIEKAS